MEVEEGRGEEGGFGLGGSDGLLLGDDLLLGGRWCAATGRGMMMTCACGSSATGWLTLDDIMAYDTRRRWGRGRAAVGVSVRHAGRVREPARCGGPPAARRPEREAAGPARLR